MDTTDDIRLSPPDSVGIIKKVQNMRLIVTINIPMSSDILIFFAAG